MPMMPFAEITLALALVCGLVASLEAGFRFGRRAAGESNASPSR